jgi:ribonuclease PH
VFHLKRIDSRRADQLREVKVTRDFIPHAEGSVLFEMGKTKIVITASVEQRVPPFLRDTGQGWITAEYAMLPRATTVRTMREATVGKIGGRTHEIQRLIGRSLRSVVDLSLLGERTIWIDCDVLQADGGTRTAAITGAFIALYDALDRIAAEKELPRSPISEFLAAVSVGILDTTPCLDLSFDEDSMAQVDMNMVMTESGKIVEIQGTAEKHPFTREELEKLINLAEKGIKQLIKIQKKVLGLSK